MKNHLITHLNVALLCCTALPLFGASVTWNNSGTNFNTAGNWDTGLPGTGDNATFMGAADVQPDLSADITIQGLTFSGTDASGYNLAATAGSLTLTNVGTFANSAIYAQNTSGTNTISAPIILGGADNSTAYFYQQLGDTLSTLVMSGNISSSGTNVKLYLNGDPIGWARAAITLSGSNSYSGGTTFGNRVTVNINSADAVGSGDLNFYTSHVDNTSGSAITLANNNDLNLQSSNYFLGSNDLSLGQGKIKLVLTGALLETAGTAVFTAASIEANASNQTFAKYGSGTLVLTGAANSAFTGGVSLAAGKLIIGDKDSLGSGLFSIIGVSTLSPSSDMTVANNVLLNSYWTIGGTNNLIFSGTITQNFAANRIITASNTGATFLSGPIFLSNSSTTGRTLTLAGAQALTISGAIADFAGSGTAGGLTISNTNTVALSALTSSYTGTTSVTVANAILEVSKLADGGTNSSIGASSNAAANLSLSNATTLRYVGSGDDTDRLFTIAGWGNGFGITLDASGSGAIHFTNTGNLDYQYSNQTRILTLAGTNTDNNSLAFALKNNGTAALSMVKNGAGTWVLSGSNTYTGKTTINNGTLQFAKQVSLYNNTPASWTGTNIIVAAGATAAFNVGGAGEFTSTDLDTIKVIGTGTSGFKTGSFLGLDTTNAVGTFTYGTVIANTNSGANSIGLKKLGTGILELTGDNTYTGDTLVNAGTLLIQGVQTGAGTVTVESGAALGGNGSIAGSLSLEAGSKFVFSLDTLTVNGANVSFGGFSIGDLIGLNGATALGTYKLIDGTASFDFTNVLNWGAENAVGIGGGKSAYFQEGSWEVVVVPEPTTWALLAGGLTISLIFRRRRS